MAEVKTTCCKVMDACPSMEDDHGCGNEETIMAQLDVDFIHLLSDWDVADAALVTLPGLPYWESLPEVERVVVMPIRGPDPPPLLAGRALLIAHQSFLI
jgi:hypothetical protein